jgi:hypothetical protein
MVVVVIAINATARIVVTIFQIATPNNTTT